MRHVDGVFFRIRLKTSLQFNKHGSNAPHYLFGRMRISHPGTIHRLVLPEKATVGIQLGDACVRWANTWTITQQTQTRAHALRPWLMQRGSPKVFKKKIATFFWQTFIHQFSISSPKQRSFLRFSFFKLRPWQPGLFAFFGLPCWLTSRKNSRDPPFVIKVSLWGTHTISRKTETENWEKTGKKQWKLSKN